MTSHDLSILTLVKQSVLHLLVALLQIIMMRYYICYILLVQSLLAVAVSQSNSIWHLSVGSVHWLQPSISL